MSHRITSKTIVLVTLTGYMDPQVKEVLENGLHTQTNTPVTSTSTPRNILQKATSRPLEKSSNKQTRRPTTTISNTQTGRNRWSYHTINDSITT
jgi:hypothetical protein